MWRDRAFSFNLIYEEFEMTAKKWYESKTLWFNVMAVIVLVAGVFGYTGELSGDWAEAGGIILAVVNLVLRIVTKQPVSR